MIERDLQRATALTYKCPQFIIFAKCRFAFEIVFAAFGGLCARIQVRLIRLSSIDRVMKLPEGEGETRISMKNGISSVCRRIARSNWRVRQLQRSTRMPSQRNRSGGEKAHSTLARLRSRPPKASSIVDGEKAKLEEKWRNAHNADGSPFPFGSLFSSLFDRQMRECAREPKSRLFNALALAHERHTPPQSALALDGRSCGADTARDRERASERQHTKPKRKTRTECTSLYLAAGFPFPTEANIEKLSLNRNQTERKTSRTMFAWVNSSRLLEKLAILYVHLSARCGLHAPRGPLRILLCTKRKTLAFCTRRHEMFQC